MIGKVIEGRYKGSNVNKLPEKNVLFIETLDGKRIALSKSNAISIEDVTQEYSTNGKKAIMVIWNDFETSIIQFGSQAVHQTKPVPSNSYQQSPLQDIASQPHQEAVPEVRRNNTKSLVLIRIGIIISLCLCIASAAFMFSTFRTDKNRSLASGQNGTNESTTEADPLEEYKGLAFYAFRNHGDRIYGDTTIYGVSKDEFLNTFKVVNYDNEVIEGTKFSFDATFRFTLGDTHNYFVYHVKGTIGQKELDEMELINQYEEDCAPGEEVKAERKSDSEREKIAETEAMSALFEKLNNDSNYSTYYDIDSTKYKIGSIEQDGNKFTVYGTIYLYNKYGSLKKTTTFKAYATVDSYGQCSSSHAYID